MNDSTNDDAIESFVESIKSTPKADRRTRLEIALLLLLIIAIPVALAVGRIYGFNGATVIFSIIVIAAFSYWISRALSIRSVFQAFVATIGAGAIIASWALVGPAWSASILGMTALIYVVVAWRLSLSQMMILVACAALVVSMAMRLGTSLGFILVVSLVPLAIASFYVAFLRPPRIEQDALVSVLEMTARAGLPLGPAVAAFGELCPPRTSRRMHGLAEQIEKGTPLPTALRGARGTLPRDAAVLAQVGWSQGNLESSLAQAVATRQSRHRQRVPGDSPGIEYTLFVAAVVAMGALMFLFVLGPQMSRIALEFGVILPGLPLWVSEAFYPVVSAFSGLGTDAQLLAMLGAVGAVMAAIVILGVLAHKGWIAPTPGIWFARRMETGALLRALSIGVEIGRPLPDLVMQIVRSDASAGSRRRWGRVFDALRRGTNLSVALRQQGIIGHADVALIESAERVGNLDWALRTVAEGVERRASSRVRVWNHAARLIAIVALGLAVGAITVTYFYPIIAILNSLVESF